MIDTVTLLAFVPAALALNFTPGADMMFCFGQGLRSGARPAMAASAGVSVGAFIHVMLAGLGLGAAVAAVPWMFDAIRWIGVAYLLYLAWGALRGGAMPEDAPRRPTRFAFRDGLLVNLTNPKVILFVLAFIPQFVDPGRRIGVAAIPGVWGNHFDRRVHRERDGGCFCWSGRAGTDRQPARRAGFGLGQRRNICRAGNPACHNGKGLTPYVSD